MNKVNSKKSHFTLLIRLLKMMGARFYLYLAAIILMSFSLSSFHTVTALLLGNIIEMAKTQVADDLFKIVLRNILLGLGCLVLYQVSFIIYTIQAKRGCANLQKTIVKKAVRLPFSYYDSTHSGDFMSKILYDGIRTEDVYGSRFRRILMPTLMVGFYLVPMFILSWQVTLCLFIISLLSFLVNTLFVRPMKKVSGEMSVSHSALTKKLSNILSGMEQIKIFSLGEKMFSEYVSTNDDYKNKQNKMNILGSSLDALNHFFDLSSSLAFLAVGIFFVSKGITSIDKLAAIYIIYANMNWNFLQIGIYVPSMASCLTNASRVFSFLDQEEEPELYSSYVSNNLPDQSGYITMQEIQFSYDKSNPILDHFSLKIEKGTCIALKGASGKGKSTVAKLLLGLYPVTFGDIQIEGISYQQMPLSHIREMIGYVPQEPYLYQVSIAENIRYGKPDASLDEIIHAAKEANIHDFIMTLEEGYDTMAGERGNRLSGGEKQRVAIARAIIKNAPILILDEATSALDNESEQYVSEALERLMKGRTTIMIAHRPSTLSRADLVVEI